MISEKAEAYLAFLEREADRMDDPANTEKLKEAIKKVRSKEVYIEDAVSIYLDLLEIDSGPADRLGNNPSMDAIRS